MFGAGDQVVVIIDPRRNSQFPGDDGGKRAGGIIEGFKKLHHAGPGVDDGRQADPRLGYPVDSDRTAGDSLGNRIGELVNNKIIDGIAHVNNESNNKEGTRVVIDLKRDAIANVVINQLYKNTDLQTSYGINNVAITKGRPKVTNLKDLISEFVEFRHEVVVRRTKFELKEAEKRAHILQGYLIALDHLDEVIRLIRNSPTPDTAKENLINAGWGIDEIQAKAILELRLQRLTGMEREKIKAEYDELMTVIAHLKEV